MTNETSETAEKVLDYVIQYLGLSKCTGIIIKIFQGISFTVKGLACQINNKGICHMTKAFAKRVSPPAPLVTSSPFVTFVQK